MDDDDDDGFWNKDKVCELTTLGKAELARRVAAGTFPAMYVLGGNPNNPQSRVGWRRRDIREWLRNCPQRPR